MKKPEPGWVVHYKTLFGTPVDWWGTVLDDAYTGSVWIELYGYGNRSGLGTCSTRWDGANPYHCTFYEEPPDEFYVWQAKRALLGELTNG